MHLFSLPRNSRVLKWIEDEQLLDLDLWEGDKVFITWLEQPGFFSGKFVYQDGKLIEHSAVFYERTMENIAQYATERPG